MNALHRKKKAFLAVLLIMFILAPRLFEAQVSLADGKISPVALDPQSYATPIWQLPTPTPPPPTLSASEANKFVAVASEFTHPESRPISEVPFVAQTLLDNPYQFDGYQVELQGKIISLNSVQRLLPNDWPVAYILVVDDSTAWIPVLYRGNIGALNVHAHVQITGVFVAAGPAIHADVVTPLVAEIRWYDNLPRGMILALIAVLLLGIVALSFLFARRVFGLLTLCLLLGGLTACQLRIETVVSPNGSVTTSVYLNEDLENTDFLREIPGMRRYIASWLTQLREQGLTVENWVTGGLEHFVLQQRYSDLASLSALGEALTTDSWVYAMSYQAGDTQCFRYTARVNSQTLYTTPPGTDSAVVNEINKYLNQMEFTYAVTLPGRIVYSNNAFVNGNQAEWRLDMRRTNELIAESCQHGIPAKPDWRWGWLAIAGGGMMDIGLWILALRKRHARDHAAEPIER